jgi:hypothetical protein
VQPVSVAEVADELYGLAPAEFTAARDERAREVRAAGQRDEAAAIKKLARPTASAWLVNQLTRTAPDRLASLYELGEELQEAQRTLAGDRLRELSAQRRQVINDLVPVASELAGRADQPASAAVLGEVRATLEAALADAAARDAVRSGRLTKALAYAGLGDVDVSGALAVPVEPGSGPSRAVTDRVRATGRADGAQRGSGSPQGRQQASGAAAARGRAVHMEADAGAASAQRAADAAERAADSVRTAEDLADEAAAAFDEAERAVASIDEQRQFLHRRIGHLEQEITEARTAHAQLNRDAKQAERRQAVAARRLETAQRSLDKARRAAGEKA